MGDIASYCTECTVIHGNGDHEVHLSSVLVLATLIETTTIEENNGMIGVCDCCIGREKGEEEFRFFLTEIGSHLVSVIAMIITTFTVLMRLL